MSCRLRVLLGLLGLFFLWSTVALAGPPSWAPSCAGVGRAMNPRMRWHSAETFRHTFRAVLDVPLWLVLVQVWNVDTQPQVCRVAWEQCGWWGIVPAQSAVTQYCVHLPAVRTGDVPMVLEGTQSPGNHCAFRAQVCQVRDPAWVAVPPYAVTDLAPWPAER